MLANTTSNVLRLTIRDFGSTQEDDVTVSLPTGTASAVFKLDDEWIGINASQAWFWTEEWQRRHEEAIADLNEGRFTMHETGIDFLAAMDEAIARNEARNRS